MALQSKNLLNEPPDIEELLNDLGHRLDRLKQLYEMYFLGIEKIEPGVARKEVQRAMLALQQQNIRNTGLRFKFNALLAKWNSYTTYWGRTIRAIENGTYVRHLQRAQRHAERDGKELPAEIVRIRERLLAATAQEKEQLRDEANAALKTAGAKAPATSASKDADAAAAPAAATKPRSPSGQYSEFNAFKNFLDDETDGFPRVEEDDLKPQRAPEPVRAKSTTPPPTPPRPTATTPPPLPPRAPIPTPTGTRPAPPPPPTGARPAPPPTPPRPPAPPASPSLPPRPTVPTPVPKSTPMAATQVVKTIPGVSENELRNLHQQYVAARQTSGENTKVSYEGLVGSLAKQVPRILEQPGVKGVRFEVTTKDGKAIVKAIPEK